MKNTATDTLPNRNVEGLVCGAIGVLGFSLTLPATHLAVASFDPVTVGLGRALIAACFAGPLLLITRQKRPKRAQWLSLSIVVAGVIIGFPLLTAWAMREVPVSHGAVFLGLIPLATAVAGSIRTGERPSLTFWMSSALGSFAVLAYTLSAGGGHFSATDFALLAAVAMAALGYTEGALLAKTLGSWQVICWALLMSVPVLIVPLGIAIYTHGLVATPASWAGLMYVSLVSMFLGFFAWYHGLAVGGIARVSQLQLLQPFITQGVAAAFLDEYIRPEALLCAVVVASFIVFSSRSRVRFATQQLCEDVAGK